MPLDIKDLWQNILITLLSIGIFALGFAISYLSLKTFANRPTNEPPITSFKKATPEPLNNVTKKEGIYNILLLGYGGTGHSGGLLTDSIIVMNIDTNTKRVVFITIPRDLWVTGNHKLNSVASAGGFQNVGGSIQNITDLAINYYVSVDFGSIVKIVDTLGGITVDIPKTFDDPFYPITGEENNTCGKTEEEIFTLKNKYTGYQLETQFSCRYEHLHYDKGPVKLNGTETLKIARSRHGDSDFGRSERQFAILKGIENKLISMKALENAGGIIDTLLKMVKTDMNIGAIKTLITVLGNPGEYIIKSIHLTTDNVLGEGKSSDGQYILNPKAGMLNFAEIKKYISDNLI